MPEQSGKSTKVTGIIVGASSDGGVTGSYQVRVNGQVQDVPNATGNWYVAGMHVTVERLGPDRMQISGLAGHWGPVP